MLEPQSTALFLILVVAFTAFTWWMVTTKYVIFRLLAGCLAFLPAMTFGVLAVNKYYDYYPTWSSAIADLTNQGVTAPSQVPLTKLASGRGPATLDGSKAYLQEAQQIGYTVRLMVAGPRSRITRVVYVYLPPQCLNQAHGPQDLTYLAVDLPDRIAHLLRVQPPGPAWGVAGYSEGGFCAANMALRFRDRYGFAGVLSGYFTPSDNQWGHPLRRVSPFGGSTRLRRENTPLLELRRPRAGSPTPGFWLGAGADNPEDVVNAEHFWHALVARQPNAPITLTRGGGHDMITWRAEVPLMLRWMTPRLARAARQEAAARSGMLALAVKHPPDRRT